jgi:uncharacterized protein (UPF0548 family)
MEPMISLHKPSAKAIEAFLISQSRFGFTYAAVGATATVPPSNYYADHNRIKLGDGEQVFLAAKHQLQIWNQFRLGWLEARPLESSIRVGGMVGIVGRSMGLWWTNACRIVYLIDDRGPLTRSGFAYGTMPAHAGSGEERFLVEWDRRDDGVWYDILAFSRPHGLLARAGFPWLRRVQHRFARESKAAMVKAVVEAVGTQNGLG